MANQRVLERPHLCGLSDDSKKFPAYAAYQNVQHLRIQCADLLLVRYRQDQSAYGSGGQCDPAFVSCSTEVFFTPMVTPQRRASRIKSLRIVSF